MGDTFVIVQGNLRVEARRGDYHAVHVTLSDGANTYSQSAHSLYYRLCMSDGDTQVAYIQPRGAPCMILTPADRVRMLAWLHADFEIG